VPDVDVTFSGDPGDANRATESVVRNLEGLSRQALQTSTALRTLNLGAGGLSTGLRRTSTRLRRDPRRAELVHAAMSLDPLYQGLVEPLEGASAAE
jgi:hypothetical protein